MSSMNRPKVTHVAIRFQSKIWSLPAPNRHHHVIRHIVESTDVKHVDCYDEDQGFLDETGRYLTRKQALVSATENEQILKKTSPAHLLFSEDVW